MLFGNNVSKSNNKYAKVMLQMEHRKENTTLLDDVKAKRLTICSVQVCFVLYF